MKHYFFIVLNNYTYETYHRFGIFRNLDQVKQSLNENERLVRAWECDNVKSVY